MRHTAPANGFTLIEAMIALFILSVGILGIIGLQIITNQNNVDAIQRTTATTLASDIIERMRINRSAAADYISRAEPVVAPDSMPATCGGVAAVCTPTETAAHDLAHWYSMISGLTAQMSTGDNTGGLKSPSACIIQDPRGIGGPVGQREYRIAIAWRGPNALTNPAISDCGNDDNGVRYGANNAYRRVFVLDAKIE